MEDSDVIFIGHKAGLSPQTSQSNGQHDKNNNTHFNRSTATAAAFNAAHNAQLLAGHQPPAGLHMSFFGNVLQTHFQQGTGANAYSFGIYRIPNGISPHSSAQSTVTSAAGTSGDIQPNFPYQVISTVQPSHRTRKNAYREPSEPVQNAPSTSTNFLPDILHPVAAASISALHGSQQQFRARKNAYREPEKLVRTRKNAHKEPDKPVPMRRNPPRNVKAVSHTVASPDKIKRVRAKKVDKPALTSKTKAKSQSGRRQKIQKVVEIPLPQPPAGQEAYEPIYQQPASAEAIELIYQLPPSPEVYEHIYQLPPSPEVYEPIYQQPAASAEAQEPSYQQLLSLQASQLVSSTEDASCPVCQTWVLAGEGVILKDCLHSFCRKCLQNAILCSQMAEVRCPFINEEYSCESHLQDSEVKCLVSSEDYERHLGRSVFQARCQATNAFYCMTPDCTGWCIMESDTREFLCPVCSHINCVACAVIHEEMTCTEFLRITLSDKTQVGAESSADQDYQSLVQLNDLGLVTNKEKFDCPICFCEIEVGEGVILKDCLHNCCRVCLAGLIHHSETVLVKCPFVNDEYACDSYLQEREIKSLVSAEEYEKHLARSLAQVEHQSKNSFHCKTPDCAGWCLFEDDANQFFCTVCSHMNCLACATIHEGQNCKQYQDLLEFNSDTSKDVKKTREYLEKQVKKNLAMKCPTCQVIVMKRDGCDWLTCSMCRTEICWATKGPRWGPGGKGDTSGGCKCDFKNLPHKPCHPKCLGCH